MKKGMTLTELLMATILMGIIMVGIVSVDYAIRQSRLITSKSVLLALTTSAAMLQITRDGMKVTGDKRTASDEDGVAYDAVDPIQNICFRYDNNLPPTPNTYEDDQWVCYSHNDDDPTNNLYRCDGLDSYLLADQQCSEIDGADTTVLALADNDNDFFSVADSSGPIEYIEITLTSRADPAADEDPLTNPSYTLKSRISPPGLSR